MSNTGQITVLDTIQGSSLLAIQAAMGAFQRSNPDLARYKIGVVREGNSVVVIFTDKDEQPGSRRDLGVRPGTDVELNADDLRVLMSKMDRITVLDTIQGSSLLAIQAAMGIFQRHNPDLAQYKIVVVREGNSVVVVFTDKDGQAGTRGSPGARPGFEVELNARDLRVLRSNFIR